MLSNVKFEEVLSVKDYEKSDAAKKELVIAGEISCMLCTSKKP